MRKTNFFDEASKILPFRRFLPFLIILFLFGFLLVYLNTSYKMIPNKHFYSSELKGKVIKVDARPRDTYFQISHEWYLIKSEFIEFVSQGDSICKNKNSFVVEIYNENSKLKWKGEIKGLIFEKVNSPPLHSR